MANKLTITVHQLPPKEFSPNSRVHWTARKRAGDAYRDEVYAVAVNERNTFDRLSAGRGNWQPLVIAHIDIEIIFAEDRIRDEDNHRARFKPGLDALILAQIIRFDDMKHITCRVQITVDPLRAPMTVITVSAKDPV